MDSQLGGKESTYNIGEGELLAPRASLSAIVFCTLGICQILKLGKKVLLRQNCSMCVTKAGHFSGDDTIFTSWKKSVASTTYENCKVFMHSIAQINASHSTCKGVMLRLRFIAPIVTPYESLARQYQPWPVKTTCSLQAPST